MGEHRHPLLPALHGALPGHRGTRRRPVDEVLHPSRPGLATTRAPATSSGPPSASGTSSRASFRRPLRAGSRVAWHRSLEPQGAILALRARGAPCHPRWQRVTRAGVRFRCGGRPRLMSRCSSSCDGSRRRRRPPSAAAAPMPRPSWTSALRSACWSPSHCAGSARCGHTAARAAAAAQHHATRAAAATARGRRQGFLGGRALRDSCRGAARAAPGERGLGRPVGALPEFSSVSAADDFIPRGSGAAQDLQARPLATLEHGFTHFDLVDHAPARALHAPTRWRGGGGEPLV